MKNLLKTTWAMLLAVAMVLPACNEKPQNEPTPPAPPQPTETSVAEALATEEGRNYTLESVLVYAVLEDLVIVGDQTGYMIVEVEEENAPAVGDKIRVSGEVATSGYYGSKGYSEDANITVLSSNNDTTLAEPQQLAGEDYDKWLTAKGFSYDEISGTTLSKPFAVEHVALVGLYNPSMDYETGEILNMVINVGVNPSVDLNLLLDEAGEVAKMFEPYTPEMDPTSGRVTTKKVMVTCWMVGAQINPNGGKGVLPLLVERVEDGPVVPRVELVDTEIILPSAGTGDKPYAAAIMVRDSEEVPTATCDNPNIKVTVDPEGVAGGGDQGIEAFTGYYMSIEAPANPSEDEVLHATITVSIGDVKTSVPVSQDPHINGPVCEINLKALLYEEFGKEKVLFTDETVVNLCEEHPIQMTFDNLSGKTGWYKGLSDCFLNIYDNDSFTISSSDPSVIIRRVEISGYAEKGDNPLTADSGTVSLGTTIITTISGGESYVTPMIWNGKAASVTLTTHTEEPGAAIGYAGIWWMRVTYQTK